jgi:Tfp pilus assembly protein PilF
MRLVSLAVLCALAWAQEPDPANGPLSNAYEALRARDYAAAVSGFLSAVQAAPKRTAIRKDLAYTYLKIGENLLAREQFRLAMEMDPADTHVALEYAFLCYETKQQAEARRVFDRLRKTGDAMAAQAFENVDRPLREGIERWKKALEIGGESFSVHFELATLAEQRDELELAAAHFEKAWRLMPERRSVLVSLGRVWQAMGRLEDANAALLAASRGGEPRAAEAARELLPERYPYVPEFRRALALDPGNVELRRELAYLLLRMQNQGEAEVEFRILTEMAPSELLSAAQLGFLLLARGDQLSALPLLQRVVAGKDEELANRVRAVLRLPQVQQRRTDSQKQSIDAKLMAERSIKAGYMKDALKYLQIAHEADPADFGVMLQLGWTHNVLYQDAAAIRWFDLARRSPDPRVAAEAGGAYRNLRLALAPIRFSAWMFPVYSSRWRDLLSYGQVKAQFRSALPVQPYFSLRFVGDTRLTIGAASPRFLSESAVIPGVGLRWRGWRGLNAWVEAGLSAGYLSAHVLGDYRGGVGYLKGFGSGFGGRSSGWFAETGADAVFISRFSNDFLVYAQNRAGYTLNGEAWKAQLHWNANLTADSKREYWANFFETGPGVRLRGPAMPPSMFFSLNLLRGAYTSNAGNPRGPHFSDVRAGVWYAFSH